MLVMEANAVVVSLLAAAVFGLELESRPCPSSSAPSAPVSTGSVVVAATLPMFHLPEAGLLLIIGIDQFFDMGRTATNVIGNSLATAVVAKYEPAEEEAVEEAVEPAMQPQPNVG